MAAAEPVKPLALSDSEQAAKLEFFEKEIRPLLVNNGYNCHSANTKSAGGLRVDDHRGFSAAVAVERPSCPDVQRIAS